MTRRQYMPPFARGRTLVEESYHPNVGPLHTLNHVEEADRPSQPEVQAPVEEVVHVPLVEESPERTFSSEVEDKDLPVVDQRGEQPADSMEDTDAGVEDVSEDPPVVSEVEEEPVQEQGQEQKWNKYMKKSELILFLPPNSPITIDNSKVEILAALEEMDHE